MYYTVDLTTLKRYLKITTTTDDTFLADLQKHITKFIENYISNPCITRRFPAEYQNGNGKEDILTKKYPVYKLVSVYDDTDRDFDSTTLISSSNYVLDYDTGRILLTGDEYVYTIGQGNIKIDYWAGLSRFLVVDETNSYLDVQDSGGTVAIEIAEYTSQNYTGYNAEDLATAIQTALNADATLNGTYTVSYNHSTQKFTIACDESFSILWNSGDNATKSIGSLLGFSTSADDSTQTSFTADNPASGLPNDIIMAGCHIALQIYDMAFRGTANVKRKEMQGNITFEYVTDAVPPVAKKILDQYKRIYA